MLEAVLKDDQRGLLCSYEPLAETRSHSFRIAKVFIEWEAYITNTPQVCCRRRNVHRASMTPVESSGRTIDSKPSVSVVLVRWLGSIDRTKDLCFTKQNHRDVTVAPASPHCIKPQPIRRSGIHNHAFHQRNPQTTVHHKMRRPIVRQHEYVSQRDAQEMRELPTGLLLCQSHPLISKPKYACSPIYSPPSVKNDTGDCIKPHATTTPSTQRLSPKAPSSRHGSGSVGGRRTRTLRSNSLCCLH